MEEFEVAGRAFERKAEIRDPESPDYVALVRRRWRDRAHSLPSCQHLPRGHRISVHVKYPHFKEAVESIVVDMGGRVDAGRQSTTIHMGKSTWSSVRAKLSDAVYMEKLGGVIPTSVSCLKKHKKRWSIQTAKVQRSCRPAAGRCS